MEAVADNTHMDELSQRRNAEEWHRRAMAGEFVSDAQRAAKILHWEDPAMVIRLADEAADVAAQRAVARLRRG